ncbi:MAG: SPOR domain-containing protein [Persicimonas sp.]
MGSNRTKKSSGGRFKRLLGWTILLAIVFSAGLITGERLVRHQNLDPLISVDEQVDRGEIAEQAADSDGQTDEKSDEERSFAFFDKLTRGDDVALSAQRPGAAAPDGADSTEKEETESDSAAPQEEEEAAEEAPDDEPDRENPDDEEPAEQADEEPTEQADSADDGTEEAPDELAAEENAAADEEPSAESGADEQPATDPDIDEESIPDEDSNEAKGGNQAARYTLQVAAHPDLESARKQMKKLRDMGLEPHVVTSSIPDKGKFYRVRVGKFEAVDAAEKVQTELREENSLSTFVSPL